MKKTQYYFEQVPPEHQEDDLFYQYKDKNTGHYELGWNDDAYVNDVIISGNKDFKEYHIEAYDKVKKIDDILYEYDITNNEHSNHCYWKNVSELINYYLAKENGKKYTTKEIHKWKELFANWNNYHEEEENELQALQLITGKKWRKATIRGCMQSEYQYLYVSEEVSDKDIEYIGMCYFNTGEEWLMYESKKDLKNNENAVSFYIDGWNRKANLAERLGCEEKQIHLYQFTGYKKIPQYEEVE